MSLAKLLLCITVGLCLAFVGGSLVRYVREHHLYAEEFRRIWTVLNSLKDRRPPHVDKRIWDCGVGWTVTAHVNAFTPSSAGLQGMYLFGEKLDKKLASESDLEIFEWIWDRLAETGVQGKNYSDRFRSQMRADMRPESKMEWNLAP
jgi:hypothetical protein